MDETEDGDDRGSKATSNISFDEEEERIEGGSGWLGGVVGRRQGGWRREMATGWLEEGGRICSAERHHQAAHYRATILPFVLPRSSAHLPTARRASGCAR